MDSIESQRLALSEFVREEHDKRKTVLEEMAKNLDAVWQPMHEKFISAVCTILETAWDDSNSFHAYVSINPASPRYLASREFLVSCHKPIEKAIITVAHELVHFIYFRKFRELFPEIEATKFEAPNLEWHLSEILVYPILNDPRVSKIIRPEEKILPGRRYAPYLEKKIGCNSVLGHFEEGYNRHMTAGKPFSEFLAWAYREAIANREIIESCWNL